jgi:hypothetical protein
MATENESPTGTPLLPPAVVRWLVPIYLIASGSGLGLLVQLEASPRVLAIAAFVVAAIGTLLGVASPGVRKLPGVQTLLALVALGCLGTAGTLACSAPQRRALATEMVNCGRQVAPALVAELAAAVARPGNDWAATVKGIQEKTEPELFRCALQALLASLSDNPDVVPTSATCEKCILVAPRVRQQARAQVYLEYVDLLW